MRGDVWVWRMISCVGAFAILSCVVLCGCVWLRVAVCGCVWLCVHDLAACCHEHTPTLTHTHPHTLTPAHTHTCRYRLLKGVKTWGGSVHQRRNVIAHVEFVVGNLCVCVEGVCVCVCVYVGECMWVSGWVGGWVGVC